jgi:lipid A 3-O-deacylase
MQLSTFVFSVLVLVVSLFPGTLNGQDQGVGDEAPLVDELVWPELDAGYYAIYLDNDMFGGTDEEYTNGVRLAWMSKAKKVDQLTDIYRFLEDFSNFTRVRGKTVPWVYNRGLSVTQLMFTPGDISVPSLTEGDRPYAGWLGAGFSLHAKNDEELHSLELSIGVVGEASLGENAQDTVHDLRDIAKAQGWDHQLDTEPTINLHYRRTRRHFEFSTASDRIEFDSFYRWGFDLGNAWTNVQVGHWVRFGYNLPTEFSDPSLSNTSYTHQLFAERQERINPWSIFLTMGIEGKAVARNIFLDGNTFSESHSVDKHPLVAEATAAVGIRYKRASLTYAHSYRTKEYNDQDDAQVYGSLSFGFSF